MHDRLPVPTDNIYKFAALFGLLLFAFSWWAFFQSHYSANNVILTTIVEQAGLEEAEAPSKADRAKIEVLKKQRELAINNRKGMQWLIGTVMCIATGISIVGFWKWANDVQPIADEAARVQLEIAKLQLEKLRGEVELSIEARAPSKGGLSVRLEEPIEHKAVEA